VDEQLFSNDKKRKLKATEQKGRHKINEQINELKLLLPECRYVSTTKASVLECAVNSLRKLQSAREQLEAANQKLLKENDALREEIESDESSGNEDTNHCSEIEFLGDPNNQPPVSFNSSGSNMNLLSDSLFQQGIYRNSSSPFAPMSSPSLPGTPGSLLTSSNSSMENIMRRSTPSPPSIETFIPSAMQSQLNTDNSVLTINDNRLQGGNQELNYKMSKRKLLLVILLIVPLFLSFEAPNAPGSIGGLANNGKSRVLLDYSMGEARGTLFASIYVLDMIRVIVYCCLGFLGLKWTTSSFIWLTSSDECDDFGNFKSLSRVKFFADA